MQTASNSPVGVAAAASEGNPTQLRPTAIAALLIGAFLVAVTVVAVRKDVREGFDEVAHLSYVADLQRMKTFWPNLTDLRMLDPDTFRFTAEMSYINHPPTYYAAMARIGPLIEDNLGALPWHRLFNVALVALGFAALLLLVRTADLSRLETLALIAPLVMAPVLPAIAGAVNNDNAAFAAGALALCGVHGLIHSGRARWLALALAGLVLAAIAKLNALLLVGGLIGAAFAYLVWRRRFRRAWIAPAAAAFLVAAAPYLAFIAEYGSPAPNTPGQQAMLESLARALGWHDAPRMSFARYVIYFVESTLEHWAPTPRLTGPLAYATLVVPLAAVICGLAGGAVAARRVAGGGARARDVVVLAGWLAIFATFGVHVVFSYQRHVATGWMLDTFPRYYIALFAIVPLSGLVLMSALPHGRARTALAAALILSPLGFNLLRPLLS